MIFKSSLRLRIERKRNELLRQRMDITARKLTMPLHPDELCRLICKERDLIGYINLLESVLQKDKK